MSDWFTFHVDQDAKLITIVIDAQTLFENQPETYDEADEVCTEVIIPIVDTLRTTCIEKGYQQTCTVDLKDVDVTLMSPSIISRMIWNIYDHNKEEPENLIKEFSVFNSNTFFRGIYKVARKLLPKYMRDSITVY